MGISLKKLGKAFLSGINPLDEKGWTSGPSNTERAQQSIRNAQQQIRQTPAKYGPLRNEQVRQSFLSDKQIPQNSSLKNAKAGGRAGVNYLKTIPEGIVNTAQIPYSGIRTWSGALTGNDQAYQNAQTAFKSDLNNSMFTNVGKFGQSVASAVLSPYSNAKAKEAESYAKRVLTPGYESMYQAYGNKPGMGTLQADIEAGQAKYRLQTDPLTRSGINPDDSQTTMNRKVLAQASGAAMDIATAGTGLGSNGTLPIRAASSTIFGGLSGLSNTAQMDNPTGKDYLTNTTKGAALGLALPVAMEGFNKVAGGAIGKLKNLRTDGPSARLKAELGSAQTILRDMKAAELRAKGSDRKILAKATIEQQKKVNQIRENIRQSNQSGSVPIGSPLVPIPKKVIDKLQGDDPKVSIRMQKDYIEGIPAVKGSALSGEGAKLPPKAGTTVASVDPITKKITIKKLGESGSISADPKESEVLSFIKKTKGSDGSNVPASKMSKEDLTAYNRAIDLARSADSSAQLAAAQKTIRELDGKYRIKPIDRVIRENITQPNESEVLSFKKKTKGVRKNTSSLNTERLDLTPEQKILAKADTTTDIGTLSNKEITRLADYAGIDSKKVGMAETKKTITEQLNLRRKMVETHRLIDESLAKGDIEGRAALLKQAAEEGSISVSQGTDIARQLQARKIMANELNTPWQKVSKLLNEAGVDPDVYSKRFAGVDLKDANEVARAYRELVPAKFGDWIEKYRYTNMLSSPLTHIVNATGNLSGSTVIAPVQKLFEGGVDATRSAITGKARTRFAGEAGASLGATFRSLPDAMKAFGDVMTGKGDVTNPDFAQSLKGSRLAVGGFKGGVDSTLEFIPKLLEAADKFTMTMTEAGERAGLKYRVGKGVKVNDIVGTANEAAKYRAFRQELGKQGQGHVLEAIDFIPQMFMRAKSNKNPLISWPARIVLPFVTTPTNLFKQGLEYSPLGITTLAGNTNKTAQVAKMLMGTTAIAAVGATAAANDGLTFNEPTSAAERDAFRAEGKQPYAVKIGGKWIGYSKLHPAISFNLALTAAVKDGLDKGTIDESGADKIMRIGGGMMGYFTDQSYMKSVGDAVNIFKGGDGASIGDAISAQGTNIANQGVPFKSMVSWIGRMVDPTQRKVDYTADPMEQIYQGVIKDIPGLNKDVPARKNPYTGENLTNDNPILNSFVPTRVTNDRGYGNTTGLNVEQRMVQKDMPAGDREAFRSEIMYQKGVENLSTNEKEKFKIQEGKGVKELPNGKFFTKVGKDYKTFDNQADAQTAVFKEDFKKSNKKSAINGDTYFYKNKAGKVVTKPKIQYEFEQVEAKTNLDMDRALAKKDINSWFAAADKKYAALEAKKGLFDPETEADEINKILLQQENLREKADKYGAYGGFTKGSSGGGGGSTASSYYGKTKSSVKGNVATPTIQRRATVKLKGSSARTVASGKPKVTIKKSLV